MRTPCRTSQKRRAARRSSGTRESAVRRTPRRTWPADGSRAGTGDTASRNPQPAKANPAQRWRQARFPFRLRLLLSSRPFVLIHANSSDVTWPKGCVPNLTPPPGPSILRWQRHDAGAPPSALAWWALRTYESPWMRRTSRMDSSRGTLRVAHRRIVDCRVDRVRFPAWTTSAANIECTSSSITSCIRTDNRSLHRRAKKAIACIGPARNNPYDHVALS